jgi:hypothetical protein
MNGGGGGDTATEASAREWYKLQMEPAKLNIRRRFWRWLLGYEQPLFTYDQADQAVRNAMAKNENAIAGQQRFQIVDADAVPGVHPSQPLRAVA